jgi:hypothetical protein
MSGFDDIVPGSVRETAAAWYREHAEPYAKSPGVPELDVRAYFAETVVPLLERKFPELLPQMSISLRGSFAFGYFDDYSDMEASIVLPDVLWLEHDERIFREVRDLRFAPHHGHPEIGVRPYYHLLRSRTLEYLGDNPPWEHVPIVELHFIQTAQVMFDPSGRLARLQEAISPARFPERLWRLLLLWNLRRVKPLERMAVGRGKRHALLIDLAEALKCALQVGHILNRRYYPHHKRLRDSFARLPELADDVLPMLDLLAGSAEWEDKFKALWYVRQVYDEYAIGHGMLTRDEIDNAGQCLKKEGWPVPSDEGWLF